MQTIDRPSISDVAGRPLEDLRKQDIRLRIAQDVGIHTRVDTRFSKRELNSIYAYLTGEHYFPKWQHGTPESPDIEVLRLEVAFKAEVSGFIPEPDSPQAPTRPYRKSELIRLCKAVEGETDQRPSPLGGG